MLRRVFALGKVMSVLAVAALLVLFALTDELHNPLAPGFYSVVGCVGVIVGALGLVFVTLLYDKLPPSKRRF